jgi:hypothetical protein
MKKLLVVAVVLVGGFFAIGAIGDATQTRPDQRDPDAKTEVVIHIDGKNYRQSMETAAHALFASCAATVQGDLVAPGIEAIGGGEYRFAVTPSLGKHGKERLLGCLNDLSVDRVKSRVRAVHDVDLDAQPGAMVATAG